MKKKRISGEVFIDGTVCYPTFLRLLESVPLVEAPEARYTLGDLLGYGSYGNVFHCTPVDGDPSGPPIVVKVMPLTPITSCSTQAEYLQWKSFLVEVLTLRDVHHGHVTELVEGFRTSTHGYVVMKRAPGDTLLQHLVRRSPKLRCPEFFSSVLTHLVLALKFLHDQGVAHHDIKPENIMCDEESGATTLLDFGSVWVEGMDDEGAVGTTMYLSSETVDHALGLRTALSPADMKSSDIYALGILTHIALIGTHPYFVHRADTLATLHSKLAVPLPPTLESTGSHVLDAMLPRMLCRQSEMRPTAEELLGMLGATAEKHNLCKACLRRNWTPLSNNADPNATANPVPLLRALPVNAALRAALQVATETPPAREHL